MASCIQAGNLRRFGIVNWHFKGTGCNLGPFRLHRRNGIGGDVFGVLLGLTPFYGIVSAPPSMAPTFMKLDIWGALRLKESDPSVDTVVYQEGTRMLLNTAVVAEPEEGADEEALQDYERTFAAQNKIDTFATFAKR